MLSIENPPRDPPCPCELKSSSDERASDKELQVVDLLSSGLDDSSNPLPKFSIRDYVFNTRSKDIKNNWPFSQKNLQLCLKHGVRDLLPPFQSADAVRNPSHVKCSVDSILADKESTGNSNGDPSSLSDHSLLVNLKDAECNPELAVDCLNINPSGSQGDKEFPSTTTSQSCSDVDSVSPTKRKLGANTLAEPLINQPPPASNKRESSNQTSVKKCRLIVKLGNVSHSSTREDNAVNNFMISEAMASKVCPVCKTFSSSSNTTLNAHIDQCLSGESTTKWMADSKVIKHKIKPKKMKSMVDICATAPYCTLEELDRRNGTSWASSFGLPAKESEICTNQNRQGSSPLDVEETPKDGAVYIDANGTKLRILSKFNDQSMDSKVVDDPRPKKLTKGYKGSKYLLAKKKKKKNQDQKQHKLLKHAPHGKKFSTPRLHHTYEINDQDRNLTCEDNYKKEERMLQQHKAVNQAKFSKPEMIRGWACSKRSGLTKKMNGRNDRLRSGDCDRDFQPESSPSSFCNSLVKKSGTMKNPNENPASLGSSKKSNNPSHESRDEYRDHPFLRKRVGLSSTDSQVCHDRKRSLPLQEFPERRVKQFKKDGPSDMENNISLSKRRAETKAGLARNVDHSVNNSKLSSSHHAILSKSRRFSSLRKKLLSAGRASVADSRSHSKRIYSAIKKSRVHHISESDEEAVASQSGVDQQQHFMQNPGKDHSGTERTSPEQSVDRTKVLNSRSGGESVLYRKVEATTLKNSLTGPMSNHHYDGENYDSFILGGVFARTSDAVESAGESVQTRRRDVNVERPSEVAVRGPLMDFGNSSNPGFERLAAPSDAQCDSQQFIEEYKSPLFEAEAQTSSAEPILTGGQEILCANEVAENMMRELDPNGQGNYFTEVDPIPIPGPPGSFLPSPGRMDSEDLQGSSSLTSSRVQSSDDHREFVDHSSESTVSATSTISNSTLAISDAKSSEKLSVEPSTLVDKKMLGFKTVANIDPVVENRSPVSKVTNAAGRLGFDELRVAVPEKGSFRFNNGQPCCCSRKEGLSQNVAINYQDSQLLRRRTMASVLVPSSGKQMVGDFDRSLDNVKSEMLFLSDRSPVPKESASAKSPMEQVSSRVSADSQSKFLICGDCESACPPASNPVLRLMGKNLMVVNKEEKVSPQLRSSQSSTVVGHANLQVSAVSGVSTENSQNQDPRIVHHVVCQGPLLFDQTETSKAVLHHPDVRWPNAFGNYINSDRAQMYPLPSAAIFSSSSSARDFKGSLMHNNYIGGYCLPTQQLHPTNRFGAPLTSDMEKAVEYPSLRWRSSDSTTNTMKEVIVIDDTPENDIDSTTVATHNQGRRDVVSSVGMPFSISSTCDSRNVNPFYIAQNYKSATYDGSPVDASFWVPPQGGANPNPVRWNCNPEMSSVLHPSSLTSESPSSAHPRSELYSSSSFQ